MKYPQIKPKFLTGMEAITDNSGKEVGKLIDFWSWAYSDLIGNTERGALAEYIVACALGVQNAEKISWAKYDLLSPEGITVEVKTSGYIQTWEQEELSSIVFGIQPTYGWDEKTNVYDEKKKRQADIYVFCVHKHKEQDTINPLDISQWEFYVLSTDILNKTVGEQKSISLSSLLKIGAEKCEFEYLHERIVKIYRENVSRETFIV